MSRSTANNDDRRSEGAAGTVGGRRGSWAGCGAGLWSLSFAGLSFHWANPANRVQAPAQPATPAVRVRAPRRTT